MSCSGEGVFLWRGAYLPPMTLNRSHGQKSSYAPPWGIEGHMGTSPGFLASNIQ